MVQAGELGAIRIIQVEYPQDWLSEPLEDTGQKQADWRTDPAHSGAGGCVGDIGTHASQLAHFVTGMMPGNSLDERVRRSRQEVRWKADIASLSNGRFAPQKLSPNATDWTECLPLVTRDGSLGRGF